MSFTGGKLKLKGGGDLSAKGGTKKKKKRAAADGAGAGAELAVMASDKETQQAVLASDAAVDVAAQEAGGSGAPAPAPPADRRTEAEKRHEAHAARLEAERAKKAALKSHRERIKELNEKLSTMTEHHDIPRISYSYM